MCVVVLASSNLAIWLLYCDKSSQNLLFNHAIQQTYRELETCTLRTVSLCTRCWLHPAMSIVRSIAYLVTLYQVEIESVHLSTVFCKQDMIWGDSLSRVALSATNHTYASFSRYELYHCLCNGNPYTQSRCLLEYPGVDCPVATSHV